MNALPSNVKWLGLGLGVWAVLACSAEASEPPPSSSPNNGSAGSASGGSGSGGTGTSPGVAGTGTPGVAGTASPGTAGTGNPGTAGSGNPGTAGTTGAGGGGALTTCPTPPAAGTIMDLKIDDLEDGDNGVLKIGGRSGYWYTYLDALGSMITPAPSPAGSATPLKPGTTMCHGASTKCIIITGTTAMADEALSKYPYAGVGFDLSNAMKPCVYNASAYTGIKFWARGDVTVTIKLNTTASASADGGGTCIGAMCNGGFSPAGADVLLSPDWTEITLPFATAMAPEWAVPGPPDKSKLLGLQIQIPPGQTYNVALDDFTFY